jgi:hypothetical protein
MPYVMSVYMLFPITFLYILRQYIHSMAAKAAIMTLQISLLAIQLIALYTLWHQK